MTGSRKIKGFYVASAGLFVVAMAAIFKGGSPTEIYTMYAAAQGITAGGFFGFNGLEHWAKAKAQNGKQEAA